MPKRVLSRFFTVAACAALAACSAPKSTESKTANTAADAKAASGEVVHKNDVILGNPNAAITVIEYASPTCPHCADFHDHAFPAIKEKFIDTGEIRFIFREFPTPPVQFAQAGAALARCAGEKSGPDGYFAMLSALFHNQRPTDETKSWIIGTDPRGAILRIASQAGFDAQHYDACISRQDLVDLVQSNAQEGEKRYGVTGTPSFVVNGHLVKLHSFDDVAKAIVAAGAKDPAAAPSAASAPAAEPAKAQ